MCLCERPAIRGLLQYREEEEEPTSATVPPHWIWSDVRTHRQRKREKADRVRKRVMASDSTELEGLSEMEGLEAGD